MQSARRKLGRLVGPMRAGTYKLIRLLRIIALAGFSCLASLSLAHAQAASASLPSDATLTRLIRESLSARPELTRAQAVVRASEERLPQVRAMPDPMLQVGIQNDGFKSIQVGHMETSFVSLMASQTFPWPGKRGLAHDIAQFGVDEARTSMARLLLTTEAEVRRNYLELLLVRDRLAVLTQLESVWENSLAMTRILYQSGSGSQSDMLRAQLEQQRLRQRRVALQAEESSRIQALNRLRNRPLTQPIETTTHLSDLPAPAGYRAFFSADRAFAKSPELVAARLAVARAGKSVALAQRSYYPDLTVGAGIMYRGALPPMWQLTVAAPVPLFGGSKQGRAVSENRAWQSAAEHQVVEVQQLVRLRSKERETAFVAVVETLSIYEQGLLIQSKATAESMLSQYRVGKGSFSGVLEANAGYLNDQEGYLDLLATAHRIVIAEAEVSLNATPMPSASGGGGSMPGTAAASMAPAAASSPTGTNPPMPAGGPNSGM